MRYCRRLTEIFNGFQQQLKNAAWVVRIRHQKIGENRRSELRFTRSRKIMQTVIAWAVVDRLVNRLVDRLADLLADL